jgi:hypothetical protein
MRWRGTRPQILGELSGRHHSVGRQQQPCQQRPFAQPADIDRPPVVFDLD